MMSEIIIVDPENTRNRSQTIKACDSKLITPLLIQLNANKNIINKQVVLYVVSVVVAAVLDCCYSLSPSI